MENHMTLYILNEVLSDYTHGMAVIAAPSLERLREIYTEEFEHDVEAFDACMEQGFYQEVKAPYQAEGLVTYVYGGG